VSREPELAGQKVVVIGGSSGIGLETARRARFEGADVILSGRNPERLAYAARELGALSSTPFDATDFARLDGFFDELPTPIDHILVTASGPYYARLADIDFARARRNVDEVLWLPLHIAHRAVRKVRPGGTLLFIGGTGGRRPAAGPLITTFTAAIPALTKALSSWLLFALTLSRPASSTRRCRHRCSAISWTRVASSSARRFPSAVWSPGRRRRSRRPPYDQHSNHRATYDIDGGQQLVED
jgi:threonine dehydrogenase-like Zn-dependent dehydrogenase